MSFEYRPGLVRHEFETPEIDGLTVLYRKPTVDALEAVVALFSSGSFAPVTSVTVDTLRSHAAVSRAFASLLMSWNLTDTNGVEQPCTAESFLSMDALFVLRVASAWARVSMGLPEVPEEPAVDDSRPDRSAMEMSIPMESLPARPVSEGIHPDGGASDAENEMEAAV